MESFSTSGWDCCRWMPSSEPSIRLLPPRCDDTSGNLCSQPKAPRWPLFWTLIPIVFSSAAQVASKSSSQFRRPTGRALKVGTRMFCPDSLHMAGRIPQRSHYRAIECRAPTPHPIRNGQGGSRPFDANSHFAFQVMLERYGDAERAALKKRLISAVLAGDEPFAIEPNGDRFRRATAWVTLRQLQASGAKSATLAAWLAAYVRAERVEGSCV